jgi:hypothetical protein
MTGYPKSFTLAAGLAFGATAASAEELRIGTASLEGGRSFSLGKASLI